MPVYEYRCKDNNHHFEVQQKMADAPLTKCIHCESIVEKLISQTSFQLKGSGWYVTDYKKGGSSMSNSPSSSNTPTATSDSPSSGSSSGGTEASSSGSCGTACACH